MTEEIIIDKEDKTKKHRNNEIDCLHFGCRKGENDNVLFWCDFYDDHCDNYTGCYYRKCLRLEQENKDLKKQIESQKGLIIVGGKQQYQYLQRIDELKQENETLTRENENRNDWIISLNKKCEELIEEKLNYRSALEKIKNILNETLETHRITVALARIRDIIDEVLSD